MCGSCLRLLFVQSSVLFVLLFSWLAAAEVPLPFGTPPANWSERETQQRQLKQWEVQPGTFIQEIELRGLQRIEEQAVLDKVQHRRGQPLSLEAVKEDILLLNAMGYFDKVSVWVEPLSNASKAGLRLCFQFLERPAIAEIEFVHQDSMTLKDLQEVAQVKPWSIVDVSKIQEDIKLLEKYYEDKGFFLAKVSYELVPFSLPGGAQKVDKQQVRLIYRVQSYDKVQIKRVQFLNHHFFSQKELKDLFREIHEGSLLSSGSFKETALKQDLQLLMYWYLDHGFLKFRHDPPQLQLSEDKRSLYFSLYLEEGEQYRLGRVSFSGDLLLTEAQLRAGLLQKSGDIFKLSERNQDIFHLTEKYQDLGYAFANVVPRMILNDQERTVDIEYEIEKGHLVSVREIRIAGNQKTYDKVIRRELKLYEGELFSGTGRKKSQENVERLGYFAPGEVRVNIVPVDNHPDQADIEIQVKERSTGSINFSLGYGNLNGFTLGGQLMDTNFLGRGQSFSIGGQFAARATRSQFGMGEAPKSFSIAFTEPYTFDSLWLTSMSFNYSLQSFMGRYGNMRVGAELRVGHPIGEYTSASLGYRIERIKDTQVNNELARPQDVADDVGLLSSVLAGLSHDERNNRYETTGGNFQSLSFETAGLGGDMRFFKWTADSRWYHRLVRDLIFRHKTEVGQMVSLTSHRGLPPSQKFYLGGPSSLRGYSYFFVSPYYRDQKGGVQPIGGNYEAFSMFELEHPLLREVNLKVATFFDVGSAWSSGDTLRLQSDIGFELRLFVPMLGPLRFSWGFPLNPREFVDDPTSVFHFMMGPPF